jgi:hypothetical protein
MQRSTGGRLRLAEVNCADVGDRSPARLPAGDSPFAPLALLQNASRQLGGLLSQADKEPGTAGVSEH